MSARKDPASTASKQTDVTVNIGCERTTNTGTGLLTLARGHCFVKNRSRLKRGTLARKAPMSQNKWSGNFLSHLRKAEQRLNLCSSYYRRAAVIRRLATGEDQPERLRQVAKISRPFRSGLGTGHERRLNAPPSCLTRGWAQHRSSETTVLQNRQSLTRLLQAGRVKCLEYQTRRGAACRDDYA